MNWGSVSRKLVSSAPALATAVGGPAGALIGGALARKLGVPDTPEAVTAAISSPAAMEKVRQEIEPFAASASQAHTEATSVSVFVRRARPVFQYALSGCMVLFTLVACYILAAGDAMRVEDLIAFVEAADMVLVSALAVFAAGSAGRSLEKRHGMADPAQRAEPAKSPD